MLKLYTAAQVEAQINLIQTRAGSRPKVLEGWTVWIQNQDSVSLEGPDLIDRSNCLFCFKV